MPYTHTKLSDLKTELASRLHDTSKVFWTDSELGVYITESLRTWNSLTGYYRERQAPFTTTSGDAFYDLEVEYSTLLDYSVTDANLQTAILHHLMEDTTVPYAGSEMFTQADITQALQRRLNQFLYQSGITLTESTYPVDPPPSSGRIRLSDTVAQVRRAVFKDASGAYHHLWQESEHTLTSYQSSWSTTEGVPFAYSIAATKPLQLQIAPLPHMDGDLEIISVSSGPTLDPSSGVVLGIPDDLSWVLKWGALADLFSREGPSHCASRSLYCQKLWEMGVELARTYPMAVNLEINGVPVTSLSVSELDDYGGGWQSSTGTPEMAGLMGDLLALYPSPDGIYSVTCDLLRSFPVPSSDLSQIEVGREHLDPILDYAEHLAVFKTGYAEIDRSQTLVQRFLGAASDYSSSLNARVPSLSDIIDQSNRETHNRPDRVASTGVP